MLARIVPARKSFDRMNAAPQDSPRAPVWRRFAALVYDLFPLLALWMITAALCLAASRGTLDAAHPPWWQRAVLLAVTAGYFVISWTRIGATIGMRAWRLRLLRADGARVDFVRALLRFAVALPPLLLLGLPQALPLRWKLGAVVTAALVWFVLAVCDRVCGTMLVRR